MARKLKTFITNSGFFELAVAAPSMKAALEAWGIDQDLFAQGFAKQTLDADTVAATAAAPGMVLRRPVGSRSTFKQKAELPKVKAAKKASKVRKAHVDLATVRAAGAALARAQARHQRRIAALDKERNAIHDKIVREQERWDAERQGLEDDLRDAKIPR